MMSLGQFWFRLLRRKSRAAAPATSTRSGPKLQVMNLEARETPGSVLNPAASLFASIGITGELLNPFASGTSTNTSAARTTKSPNSAQASPATTDLDAGLFFPLTTTTATKSTLPTGGAILGGQDLTSLPPDYLILDTSIEDPLALSSDFGPIALGPIADGTLHLDFGPGTAPVADGYISAGREVYSSTRGYGWQSNSGLSTIDRGGSDDLTRDQVRGTDHTFKIDLPNGTYKVTATVGDSGAVRDNLAIYAEGVLKASNISTARGEFKAVEFEVQVTDGQLNLRFDDQGGKNGYFSLAGLDVVPVSAPAPAPPTANAGVDQAANEGGTVSFAGSATGTGLTYQWNFGDGSATSNTLTTSHTYRDNGTYAATLTVTDSLGRTSSDTAIVTVSNVKPTATFTDNNPINEGSAVTVSFTNQADPSPEDIAAGFKYSYDFNNDGTWDVSNSTNPNAIYTFTDNGSFTVKGRITDKDGGFNDYTTVVDVTNVAPSATFAASSNNPLVNTAVTFTFSSPSDPSVPDTQAGFKYSYDFNGDGTFDVIDSTSATAAYTFVAVGTYTARGRITDKDGGARDYTTTLTVQSTSGDPAPLRTLYVSTTGSDSNNGSASSPFRTLQYAANQSRAGDLIIVRAGNYAGFNITRSGTATNRIIFQAETGVVINTPLVISGTSYGINASGQSYVTIEGFTITPQSTQGAWVTGIRMGGTPSNWARGNIIRNNTVQMRVVGQSATVDTYGIYTSWQDGLLVQGNKVSGGFNSGIYTANSSKNYTIRGNEVFNVGGNGIHNNGDLGQGGPGINYNGLIENNIIHNVGFGLGGQAISADGLQDSRIQNNLIYDAYAKGISLYASDAAEGSKRVVVANNTVIMAPGAYVAVRMNEYSRNNTFINNIFLMSSSTQAWVDIEEDSAIGTTFDYNLTTGVQNVGGSRRTDWKTTYGFDTHSIVATAANVFVNPASKDFHLKAGSPAIDAGTTTNAPVKDRDGNARPYGAGIDIGAYEFGSSPGPTDNESPTVSITGPANNATVSGVINLTATAADNVGVVGVQFYLDGNAIGSEDTTAPYSVSWNSATATNGVHTLTARARDAAGNVTISSAITITVSNATPTGGLVAAYNFNEGTGTTLLDRSGSGFNGSISGATWNAGGKTGGALRFDGVNDVVTIGDAAALDLSTGMTLEAWVRPETLSGWSTILMKEAPGGLAYSLYASDDSNNPPAGYINTGGTDNSARGGAALALNTWTHLAVTYDGSSLKLYVNGALASNQVYSGSIISTGGNLSIGGNSVWGEYFKGLIDDVRIYNQARTQSQIQSDMNTSVS